ncbi:MAG TPA: type II secretion system F family protein [Armatimonadetes bacterium]|nr:type II secretion system F family protein [Armatimonadota bacterium]
MPQFTYVAKDTSGQIVRNTAEAENERALVQRLRAQGYFVTEVKKAKGPAAAAPARVPAKQEAKPLFAGLGRVKGRDLAVFCRQFSTMINAGVSLVRCLTVLEEQSPSYKLKEVIRDIQAKVEAGEMLSTSLESHPRVFSNLFVGLVRAGEVGGVLDESLQRLADFLEADQELRRKIKSSMTYPTLVLFVAVGIVLFLMTYILPKFMKLFEDLGVEEFPLPTLILKNISDFLIQKWWIAFIGIVAFVVAFGKYKRTKTGKRHWDWFKLKVPVFGKLNHKIALARFSRTLSTLLTSGVPILNAMETVAGTVDNDIIADAVMKARASIREGEAIGPPLAESGYFPPMVVQMISIGEETGALDQMLAKIADFYESEVAAALESLTAALEPVMIVMLGFIVGFIVISMFLPLIAIISELSGSG